MELLELVKAEHEGGAVHPMDQPRQGMHHPLRVVRLGARGDPAEGLAVPLGQVPAVQVVQYPAVGRRLLALEVEQGPHQIEVLVLEAGQGDQAIGDPVDQIARLLGV